MAGVALCVPWPRCEQHGRGRRAPDQGDRNPAVKLKTNSVSGNAIRMERQRRAGMHDAPTNAAWRQWLQAHAPKLLLFARQQCRSEADAQDLVQEAVVEAAGRRGHGSPPEVALVLATLRRRAIDLARREDRRAVRELAAAAPAPTAWFDTSVEDRETSLLMQKAMQQLPDIHREVITLKVWGDLTFAEIAEVLEISPNTAASRYRYGLTELRRLTKEIFA